MLVYSVGVVWPMIEATRTTNPTLAYALTFKVGTLKSYRLLARSQPLQVTGTAGCGRVWHSVVGRGVA